MSSKQYDIDNNEDLKTLTETLRKEFSSANINYIIGSGTSLELINVGVSESQLKELYDPSNLEPFNNMLNLFKNEILAHTAIYKNESSYNRDNNFDKLHELMKKYPNFSTFDSHNPYDSVKSILTEHYDNNIKNYLNFINTLEIIFNQNFNNIRNKQINIFTTNYDLLLEDSISKNNKIFLNDGFGKNSNYTNNVEFNSANYFKSIYSNGYFYNYRSEDFTINLFKLHGSLNWESIYDEKLKKDKIIFRKDINTLNKENFKFILPTRNKFNDTVMEEQYYDQLRILSNQLDCENSILFVMGFSFSDEHISHIIHRALSKNPTLKVYIYCYSKESVEKFSAKNELQHYNVNYIIKQNDKLGLKETVEHLRNIVNNPKNEEIKDFDSPSTINFGDNSNEQ